jgi:predicted chitinase
MNEKQIAMVKAAVEAGITSPKEIANFIAQISHESGNLTRMDEGFRYTKGIDQIPVKSARREGDVALEAARKEALDGKPERLAELMYGGRMGNNEPGDGFKYHGRGYMQLTGKDNYRDIGNIIGVDLVAKPELAAAPENVSRIAVEFWKSNVPKDAREDVTKATTAINNGSNGLDERKKLYAELYKELTPSFLDEIKQQVASKQASVAPASDNQFQSSTVEIGGRERFTVNWDPAGKVPASIFQTPEMNPPPLAVLTKPLPGIDDIKALLETGILKGKGEPYLERSATMIAASPEIKLQQQPVADQSSMRR